jgi:hypothetical protein
VSTTTSSDLRPGELSSRRHKIMRIGLVLAGIMSVFNLANGIGSLIDPQFGQSDPSTAPQPTWISVTLVVFGALTLAWIVPAWRGRRSAAMVVVGSRLAEGWSGLILPFLPDAPDGILGPMILLACVSTLVAAMVAQGWIGRS